MISSVSRWVRKGLWTTKYFGFNTLLSIFTHKPHEPIIIKCINDEVNATPYLLRWLLHAMDLGYVRGIHCGDGEFIVINAHGSEVHVKYDGGYYVINGYRFKMIGSTFIELFLREDYHDINIHDKVIIDVGAYVGDSAIYFAFRGARRVIAIEPHPGVYAEMLDNIKLNNLESVIIPINAGLTSKPGKICVENTPAYGTAGTYHRPGDCPNTVPAITSSELISRFGVDPNDAVLKMDCEGCEYDVVLNDYEHIRLFREVVFEYHGDPVSLLKVMTNDFDCKLTRLNGVGFIHCKQKT